MTQIDNNLVNNQGLFTQLIYDTARSINNNLHVNFGMKNLYHRTIFTACALVAERYGAKLEKLIDCEFSLLYTRILNTIHKSLEDRKQQNIKLHILEEVYAKIDMNYSENQNAINSFIKDICTISNCVNSNEWRGEDVMGIFFNEFNRYKKKSEAGQVFTPEHITSFMYRLIGVTQNDYLGDFTCGSGAFLVKGMSNMMREAGGYDTNKAKEIRKEHLYGIEWDKEIYTLACANMLIHKDSKTNLEQADMRTDAACEWIKSKPITKVLMNPPYENKYGCMTIVENVLNSVKTGTDCAFILPDKKLEKASLVQMKRILSNHRLVKIVKLPESLFLDVGVTTSIFVFKTGEPQSGQQIFGCYIEDDGFETVKNKGRQDVKHKWQKIEDYWIDSISKLRDTKYGTAQYINPFEHLSYQMPEKPFGISEEDFKKTAMDYICFKHGINTKEFGEKLLNAVLYGSKVNLDDTGVNIKIGTVPMLDTSMWKEFRVGDLFDIHPTKAYKLTNAQLLDDGEYPVVTNSAYNNGIGGYSTQKPTEKGNMITFSDTVNANTIFYQPNDFVGYPHVQGLYPLMYKDMWNKYTYSFFASVFREVAIAKGFDYDNKFRRDVAVELIIKLPATADEQPDWAYMKSYMKSIMEESEKSLENLKKLC